MEKSTPHCKLPVVKAMITEGRVRSTLSALAGGAALGQDVYRPTTPAAEVYLKLTVIDDVLIVSFKEL